MSLPIILNTPTYDVELPISNKTITYRPYLVKEEKVLLMALESKDQKLIMKTIQDVINVCTFEKLNVRELPTAELELLFLKLRSKSVGETSTVGYECKECHTVNDVVINLNDIEISKQDKTKSNKIMVTDSVGIKFKYPTADDITRAVDSDAGEIKNTFGVIIACVESIFDAENVYTADNMTKKDIEEFIDSLNTQQFAKIQEFFTSIPKLQKEVKFKCQKCGTHNELTIEGVQSFFV